MRDDARMIREAAKQQTMQSMLGNSGGAAQSMPELQDFACRLRGIVAQFENANQRFYSLLARYHGYEPEIAPETCCDGRAGQRGDLLDLIDALSRNASRTSDHVGNLETII